MAFQRNLKVPGPPLVLSIGLDYGWKRVRDNRSRGGTPSDVQVGN